MSHHDYKSARAVAVANCLDPETISEMLDTLKYLNRYATLEAGDMAHISAVLKMVDADLDGEMERYQIARAGI